MQTIQLPISICNKLDKLNTDFLWGHNEDKAKIHLVKWDSVCKLKSMGGLGLKQTHLMNQALLAKMGWKLLQKDQGLLSRVLHEKCIKSNNILNINKADQAACSTTWRGILFGTQILPKGLT